VPRAELARDGLEAKVERLREMLNFVAGQTDNAGRIASEAHASRSRTSITRSRA
jgi:hypothetical protein